jgi:serine/threonine-protein kinase
MYAAARYPEAKAAFQRVTELQPDSAQGYQQLGTVLQAVGDSEGALQNYLKAAAIRPTGQLYSNLGMLYHLRQEYTRAVEAYRQAIKLRPNSSATYRNLGDALSKLDQAAEARTAYLAAVRLSEGDLKVNPNDARTIASLALYLQKAGETETARTRIDEALAKAPRDVEVLFKAAEIHALAGRTDPALAALRAAVEGGYSRTRIAEEEDFSSLRGLAKYRELVQPVKP